MTDRYRVEVRDESAADLALYSFSRLPIALGRHARNDVRLARRFVSSFHARLDESAGRLYVVDLGSTNGVFVRSSSGGDKIRIDSHEPHDLGASEGEFSVGQYVIRLLRVAPAKSQELGSCSLPSLLARELPPLGAAAAGALAKVRAPSAPPVPFEAELRRADPGSRSKRARETAALAGLEQLARALSPGNSLETSADVAQLIRRLHTAIQLSCRGVVQLRRGHRRCLSALRLPSPVAAEASLSAPEDAADYVRQLLDVRRPGEAACAALAAEFRALASHQVALFEGVLEGAGALLGELSPERVESDLRTEGRARALGLGSSFRARWRAYRERHGQLSRRDGVLSLVFGRAFREAYAAYLRGAGSSARDLSALRAGKLG